MNSAQTEKIRVLIADDSFFIRTYLSELLGGSSSIEVVGVASSGTEVVALARKLRPDVITMDYHMPGKNGIEATAEIMLGERPLPAIIMVSAFLGEDGARVKETLLATGAHLVVKPSGEISLDIERVASSILTKIEEVGRLEVKMRKAFAHIHHPPSEKMLRTGAGGSLRGVLIIGASTGGPPLVEHLLGAMDPLTGIAVVIVQHMSPYFTMLFAERLDRVTSFHVHEAKDGDTLLPGEALVVPGGSSLSASLLSGTASCILTVVPSRADAPEEAIDNTMSAIAKMYPGPLAGVLLSGMGKDGTVGLRAIRRSGGLALAQDPMTAVVGSMSQHALDEGEATMVQIENVPALIAEHFVRVGALRGA